MKILKVEVSGYQVLGEVTWELPQRGLWLINGINNDETTAESNGSGKSTIFDSIFYARYGESLKKVKVDSLTNFDPKYQQDGMYVKLTETDGKHVYEIIRSRDHKVYGSGLKVLVDGEDISTHLKVDIQEYLVNDIYGQDVYGFKSQTYLSNNMYGRFTQLSDSDKRWTIETNFKSEDTSIFLERAKSKLSVLRQDEGKHLSAWELEESILDNLQKDRVDLDTRQKELELKKDEKVKDLIKQKATYESDITTTKAALLIHQTALSEGEDNIKKLDTEKAEHVEAKMIYVSQMDQATNKMSHLRLQVAKIEATENTCAICNKDIKEHNEKAKRSLNDEIRGHENDNLKLQTLLDTSNVNIGNFTSAVESLNGPLRVVKDGLAACETAIKVSESQIASTKKLIEEAKLEVDLTDLITSKNEAIVTCESNKSEASDKLKATREEIPYYEVLIKHVFDHKGMRAYILQYYVNILNQKLLELGEFIGKGDIIVQVTCDTSSRIGFEILNFQGEYASISDGQKRYVDLMIQLALYESSVDTSTPFLILDEVLSVIDNTRVENIIRYLDTVATTKAVYLVTHNTHCKRFIHNNATFIRDGGLTTLQIGAL